MGGDCHVARLRSASLYRPLTTAQSAERTTPTGTSACAVPAVPTGSVVSIARAPVLCPGVDALSTLSRRLRDMVVKELTATVTKLVAQELEGGVKRFSEIDAPATKTERVYPKRSTKKR